MPQPPAPRATVVITGRNRTEDLIAAIASCLAQSIPIEVLVIDDASDDGTPAALVQKFPPGRFPMLRIIAEKQRVGYIVLRNRGAALAQSNIIISIDDDAIFTTPHIVEQTLAAFDHPRVGAVAIPFQNIRISDTLLQRAPDHTAIHVTADFIGTAHALRKDLFLRLGGYRACFVHQGEESDYCLRMLDAGYVVRLGTSDPIHHFVSPKRDLSRLHFYGSRNNILFVFFNVPALRLPIHLFRATAGTLLHALRVHALGIKLRAVFAGYRDAFIHRRERRPVHRRTLALFRRLRQSPQPISAIEAQLPHLVPTTPSKP